MPVRIAKAKIAVHAAKREKQKTRVVEVVEVESRRKGAASARRLLLVARMMPLPRDRNRGAALHLHSKSPNIGKLASRMLLFVYRGPQTSHHARQLIGPQIEFVLTLILPFLSHRQAWSHMHKTLSLACRKRNDRS